ncbi:hypothetical protein, partial [Klebsiella grimontii]
PAETTARDVAVVVVPVIREPEKMTMVKRVAGVHSIYRPPDGGEPVTLLCIFPEAALTRLSGLRSSDGGEPVARPSAAPPGKADDASA